MKFVLQLMLSITLIFSAITPAQSDDHPQRLDPRLANSMANRTDNPLQQADYYSQSWDHESALKALAQSGRTDAEVLWRQARSLIDSGENLEGDVALVLFEQAREKAEQAVELDPENALAQQTLAVACGRVALFKGVFKSIGLVKQVYQAAHRAVALGDSMPIALYVLGRTHKKLMTKSKFMRVPLGLGFASKDSIGYYFDRAQKVSKGNMIQCYVEYAEYLIDGKIDILLAKELLTAAKNLPLRDEQDGPAKAKAEEMFKVFK